MTTLNAGIFIAAQFGSRFANSFLTTAVRYELLEVGGVKKFASAQVATQIARVFMQQVAGILTDNYPLKRLYVLGEAINLLLVFALIPAMYGGGGLLFAINIGFGLAQAFTQPVAKSMPPTVVKAEDLAIVNSWDLTGDKVARNLAPMVFTVVSSALGFQSAVIFSITLCSVLVLLKQLLQVTDKPISQEKKSGDQTVGTKLLAVFKQVWGGILTLKSDRIIGLLILNTLVTNMLVYPLGSVVFPVIFKAVPEGSIESENSFSSNMILKLQDWAGIQKGKAWMNYAAIVSLGGVIGPFISSAAVYHVKAMAAKCPEKVNWIGINMGLLGQLSTLLPLIFVMMFVQYFTAGTRIFLLFVVWGLMTALNNVTTIFFNAHTQNRLARSERGRFIANILTLFTLANSVGSLMYGWALDTEGLDAQVSMSTRILMLALLVRLVIVVLIRSDTAGQQTIFLKVAED